MEGRDGRREIGGWVSQISQPMKSRGKIIKKIRNLNCSHVPNPNNDKKKNKEARQRPFGVVVVVAEWQSAATVGTFLPCNFSTTQTSKENTTLIAFCGNIYETISALWFLPTRAPKIKCPKNVCSFCFFSRFFIFVFAGFFLFSPDLFSLFPFPWLPLPHPLL